MGTFTVIATFHVENPMQQAEAFRLLLAMEKGYSSTLEKFAGGYRVIASDDRAVEFYDITRGL